MSGESAGAESAPVSGLQGAVGERIDGLTNWQARYWAPLIIGLVMFGDSWDSIVVAYVMPALRQEWPIDAIKAGALITAAYVGQLLGAITLGPLAEKVGRMPIFYASILFMSVLSVACAFAPNVDVFMALRFVEGIGIGGAMPVAVSYINELAPTKTRGRYFSLFQFVMVSGMPCAAIASSYIVPNFGWHAMFLLGGLPALLVPVVMLTLPESPRWLAKRGRFEDMNKALARLGGPPIDNAASFAEEAAPARIPLAALFAPKYFKLTVMLGALWFLNAFVGFGFANWAPTLYVDLFGVPLKDALQYIAIASFLYIWVPLIFAAVIDKIGRRGPAIAIGVLAVAAIVGLIFVDHANVLMVAILFSTGWVAAASVSVLAWPYTAESYPTEIRATGVGFVSALARGSSMLTPIVVGAILVTKSAPLLFGLFACCSSSVLLIWIFGAKETARRSLEEIAASGKA
jgi:putative MFS transporter